MMYIRFFWLYCAVFFICSTIFAKESPSNNTTTFEILSTSTSRHELTDDDVGAFFDGLIPLQIGQADIAGAVIAIVKDSAVVFAKSYGYADTQKNADFS